ncbi:MAG: Rrf2 family transcriptional regulator [Burkholderiales bacterium]
MRLTMMSDYALRLLMYAAQQPDRLCTIAEVAQAHAISEAHLMKVTHQLAVAGWLVTVRGKGGGLRLARPAREINLGAVVRDIEPDFFLVECFASGSACALTGRCRLTGVLQNALQGFMDGLDRHTLADIVPPAKLAAKPGTRKRSPVVRMRVG